MSTKLHASIHTNGESARSLAGGWDIAAPIGHFLGGPDRLADRPGFYHEDRDLVTSKQRIGLAIFIVWSGGVILLAYSTRKLGVLGLLGLNVILLWPFRRQ